MTKTQTSEGSLCKLLRERNDEITPETRCFLTQQETTIGSLIASLKIPARVLRQIADETEPGRVLPPVEIKKFMTPV